MYAYAKAGSEECRETFLLYPASEPEVRDDFNHEDMTLKLRQLDLRKIHDPETGSLNVGETVGQLGAALRIE